MLYEPLHPITQGDLQRELESADVDRVTTALFRMALHEEDREYAEQVLGARLADHRPEVRAAAARCVGHVARRFGMLGSASLETGVRALLTDESTVGAATDALGDIEMFYLGTPELNLRREALRVLGELESSRSDDVRGTSTVEARLEALARAGSGDAAEGIAEMYAQPGGRHDLHRAYFWYHVAFGLRPGEFTTQFANISEDPTEYRGMHRDFRELHEVRPIVRAIGIDVVHEEDQRAEDWLSALRATVDS